MNPTPSNPSTVRKINAQTPGPFVAHPHTTEDGFAAEIRRAEPMKGRLGLHTPQIASVKFHVSTHDDLANARLLASSYTAFDKAGRALGVDATELAEKIDLAELIGVILDCENRWDKYDDEDAPELGERLRKVAQACRLS